MLSGIQNFANESVLTAEELSSGGKISVGGGLMTALIGMVVVFAVLLILILCIEGLHALLKDRASRTKEETAAPAPAQKENTARISAGTMAVAPEAGQAADDPEFLAAVSACISAVIGKPNGSFTITSIQKGE